MGKEIFVILKLGKIVHYTFFFWKIVFLIINLQFILLRKEKKMAVIALERHFRLKNEIQPI